MLYKSKQARSNTKGRIRTYRRRQGARLGPENSLTFSSWWRAIQTWTLSMDCQKRNAPKVIVKYVATRTIFFFSNLSWLRLSLRFSAVEWGICDDGFDITLGNRYDSWMAGMLFWAGMYDGRFSLMA
jgi:hypothetical protein